MEKRLSNYRKYIVLLSVCDFTVFLIGFRAAIVVKSLKQFVER